MGRSNNWRPRRGKFKVDKDPEKLLRSVKSSLTAARKAAKFEPISEEFTSGETKTDININVKYQFENRIDMPQQRPVYTASGDGVYGERASDLTSLRKKVQIQLDRNDRFKKLRDSNAKEAPLKPAESKHFSGKDLFA